MRKQIFQGFFYFKVWGAALHKRRARSARSECGCQLHSTFEYLYQYLTFLISLAINNSCNMYLQV